MRLEGYLKRQQPKEIARKKRRSDATFVTEVSTMFQGSGALRQLHRPEIHPPTSAPGHLYVETIVGCSWFVAIM